MAPPWFPTASACWSNRLPKRFTSGAVCVRTPRRSSPHCAISNEKTLGLDRACAGDLLRPVAALPVVDFRAHLLVDKIQPVHQRVHGKPPGNHAGQESGCRTAPSVGALREDFQPPK